jgi:serine/threonine-protein kinase
VWAFGCVLFEMLTGRPLFAGETTSEIVAAVLKEEPDLVRVPNRMRRLLQVCLQKDPKQRLQAIGDWRLFLEDAQEASPKARVGCHERLPRVCYSRSPCGVGAVATAYANDHDTSRNAPRS